MFLMGTFRLTNRSRLTSKYRILRFISSAFKMRWAERSLRAELLGS